MFAAGRQRDERPYFGPDAADGNAPTLTRLMPENQVTVTMAQPPSHVEAEAISLTPACPASPPWSASLPLCVRKNVLSNSRCQSSSVKPAANYRLAFAGRGWPKLSSTEMSRKTLRLSDQQRPLSPFSQLRHAPSSGGRNLSADLEAIEEATVVLGNSSSSERLPRLQSLGYHEALAPMEFSDPQ